MGRPWAASSARSRLQDATAVSRIPETCLTSVVFTSQEEDRRFDLGEAEELAASSQQNAHLFRLFVGWVPKLFTEGDLKPLFDQVRRRSGHVRARSGVAAPRSAPAAPRGAPQPVICGAAVTGRALPALPSPRLSCHPQWGDVKDIIVLKDKVTGQPRGCAFVSYATREEAEAAIRHLDRRVQLPGALNKLEVRMGCLEFKRMGV